MNYWLLLAITGCAAGGWCSRMCGGGRPRLPWGLDQWLFALPYGAILLYAGHPILAVAAYLAAVAGARTGHGQYLSLGRYRQQRTLGQHDEKLDFIVRFFFGLQRGPDKRRDIAGLVVTGLAVTLLCGLLLLVSGHFIAGLLVGLSGALKPTGYVISDWMEKVYGYRYTTTLGEFTRGVINWGAVACSAYLL